MDDDELDDLLEEGSGFLDAGEPDRALLVAKKILSRLPDDLSALELRGLSETDLGEMETALVTFRRMTKVDRNDPVGHSLVASTLTELGRLPEAMKSANIAMQLDPELLGALLARAWLHDIAGRDAEADADYLAAATLDPENYPAPLRLTRDAFDRATEEAHAELPEEFQGALKNVSIVVHDFPPLEIVQDPESPITMSALGYFDGPTILDRSNDDPLSLMPAHILLFKRSLERACTTEEELREEIAITLQHEIAHYLGWDEDDVARMGLE